MNKNVLNMAEVDEVLQKYGDGIISDCYPIIKSGSPVEEYGEVILMIELPSNDTFSYMLAKKAAAEYFGISLTKYDFSRGEDEPADSRTVLSCKCSGVGQIRPSIDNLRNAERLFYNYMNKLLELATQ